MTVDVVIPTTRPEALARLREALGDFDGRVIVVDGRGIGPAAARNLGWRRSDADWVCFLDDDVVPEPRWAELLRDELAAAPAEAAGVQGRVVVPLPRDRRPTDWERNVAGLQDARWATADMAYRRSVLVRVGGFDERFRRAYREDADLALRVMAAGHRLVRGDRAVLHPVGPASRWTSVARQRGNADDVLMDVAHGPEWRARAEAPAGLLRRHLAGTAAGAGAIGLLAAGRPRAAAVPGAAWMLLTGAFAARRIAPGPGGSREVGTMLATSVAIPPAAAWWRLIGVVRHGLRGPGAPAGPPPGAAHEPSGEAMGRILSTR